jgi:DNA-binding response OmpR family regulator
LRASRCSGAILPTGFRGPGGARQDSFPEADSSDRGSGVPLAKVLIVESDVLQALALEDEVTAAGHEVVGPAASVAAARELIARKRPDLALIEVVLGGGMASEGATTYALARKLDIRGIPFAFVTKVPPARIRARWRGRAVLRKPYDRARLRVLLRACLAPLGGRSPTDDAPSDHGD